MFSWFKKKKLIATHNGSFHADDVVAMAVLTLWCESQGIAFDMVRTRDAEVLEMADYVFDVGGIYDHSVKRYDHHQKGRAGEREDTGVPYAAAGLIWKHYGLELCGGSAEAHERVDLSMIQTVDALDNGMVPWACEGSAVHPFTLSSVIGSFNADDTNSSLQYEAFMEALNFTRPLVQRIINETNKKLARRDELRAYDSLKARENKFVIINEVAGRIDVWEAFNYEFSPEVLYVLHMGSNPDGDRWKITAIRDPEAPMQSIKALPEAWRGLPVEELKEVTGVDDIVFCHVSGFMAVVESLESAKKLAKIAIKA